MHYIYKYNYKHKHKYKYINDILYIVTSLIPLRWPYIIYINSLQNYTYKTARIVCAATKLTITIYSN